MFSFKTGRFEIVSYSKPERADWSAGAGDYGAVFWDYSAEWSTCV